MSFSSLVFWGQVGEGASKVTDNSTSAAGQMAARWEEVGVDKKKNKKRTHMDGIN